jgi:hypothetical protein
MTGLFIIANLSESEVAWQMELLICWVGLVVIGAIIVAAFAFRSWKIATLAVVLVLLFTIVIKPWHVFASVAPEAYADPWGVSLQRLGIAWVVAVVSALASLALGLANRSPKHDTGDTANDT